MGMSYPVPATVPEPLTEFFTENNCLPYHPQTHGPEDGGKRAYCIVCADKKCILVINLIAGTQRFPSHLAVTTTQLSTVIVRNKDINNNNKKK